MTIVGILMVLQSKLRVCKILKIGALLIRIGFWFGLSHIPTVLSMYKVSNIHPLSL